jgi:hypothetical protein
LSGETKVIVFSALKRSSSVLDGWVISMLFNLVEYNSKFEVAVSLMIEEYPIKDVISKATINDGII